MKLANSEKRTKEEEADEEEEEEDEEDSAEVNHKSIYRCSGIHIGS